MAALKALVQTRFPFAGKLRVPGDTIKSEELEMATPQVRDALVRQGHIVLVSADGKPVGGAAVDAALLARIEAQDERIAGLAETIEAQAAEIAKLNAALNEPSDELVSAIEQVVVSAVDKATAQPGASAVPAEPAAGAADVDMTQGGSTRRRGRSKAAEE